MSGAKHTPARYSPENPPPLRRVGESVEDYRVRCGWDAPKQSAMHTPGPWQAIDWECHAATTIVQDYYGSRTVIAECSGHGRDTRDCLADARLIAAAPELLAAVQLVANLGEYRELVEKMAEALRPHERASFVKLFREDARAAIAKATGQS